VKNRIKTGVRPSRLARIQAEEIAGRLPYFKFDIVEIETEGDRDKAAPIIGREKTDLFTRDIEMSLIDGDIDIAIHSAKDLEDAPPAALVIAATTRSVSPLEALVSKESRTLQDLPSGSIVGTSSRRRQDAILRFRQDLVVKDIRGNVDERIRQMERGDYDAIIVAHAALIRLGLSRKIAQIIPQDIMEPHPLQGRLSIQVKKERTDLVEIFRGIDDR